MIYIKKIVSAGFLLLLFRNKVIYKIFNMDYKKKSLKKLNHSESYEEIDTRLASGWYVDSLGNNKKKSYKTNKVPYKISKKSS